MKNLIVCISLALLCLTSATTFSQTTFTGVMSTNWANTGNWDNGLPSVDNSGTIPVGLSVSNSGTISISGIIENYGTINNAGTIINESGGNIHNFGSIYNSATIYNFGVIYSCNGAYIGILPNINPLETTDCLAEEFCDGIDNDGDGQIDEECGCTTPSACNYDELAFLDDGGCEYLTCQGCTGQLACNYDPTATLEDGSCDYTTCAGCTYELAPEYDSSATIDDGSCAVSQAPLCQADLNGDLFVDTQDLLIFLVAYNGACD